MAGSKRFKKEKGIISGVQKARNDAFYNENMRLYSMKIKEQTRKLAAGCT
ncbi:hypothetical protein [Streptococcus infantis]